MEFKELITKSKEVQEKYRALDSKEWGAAEYTQGLVGDVGDLVKLIMAKNGFRKKEDIDAKLSHELSDCLWSIILIAEELEIDLEGEFMTNMEKLKKRIDQTGQ